ncbi:MAG: hypothetical protein K5675_09345 [Lachnospiraceae bacterium]|nr:hypothetical protein [Lachnospiraceae bacterium]
MENCKNKVSLSHIADIYLYEYYVAKEQPYELELQDKIKDYIKKSHELMEEMEYEDALKEWMKVLKHNPVCMEAYNGMISCYKYLYNIEKEYEITLKTYNFSCTRAELAAYYRNLGWYYLESYQPNVAVACYKYSDLFETSEQVKSEISYLETALEKSYQDMSVDQIQNILTEKDIPLKANSITLALIYKAGLEAYNTGNNMQARDCFHMVYDLTQDEEIKQLLDKVTINESNHRR